MARFQIMVLAVDAVLIDKYFRSAKDVDILPVLSCQAQTIALIITS